jgi:hypothetical protein
MKPKRSFNRSGPRSWDHDEANATYFSATGMIDAQAPLIATSKKRVWEKISVYQHILVKAKIVLPNLHRPPPQIIL